MLKHVSQVISDETKRLRFQVEKVLQMSLFDRNKATIRLKDVDAHAIIDNVVSTYRIKAEKFGGHITADFSAEDSIINVDEMHFTKHHTQPPRRKIRDSQQRQRHWHEEGRFEKNI